MNHIPRKKKPLLKRALAAATPKALVVLVFALAIGGYTLYQTRALASGPRLELTTPADGATVTEQLVEVRGTAERIANLFVNDNKIFTSDTAGNFSEKVLLAEGYNTIVVKARDQFGRVIEKTVQLFYQTEK